MSNFPELPLSRKEWRKVDSPSGMAQIIWRRYYRRLRLWWRAENARIEHEIMWGNPSAGRPVGILNAGGFR